MSDDWFAEQQALTMAVEGDGTTWRSFSFGAGAYVYWALGHHVKAAEVKFAEVLPDSAKSEMNSRYGQIFIITDTAVILASYAHAADENERYPQQDFGTTSMQIFPLRSAESISWKDRSLAIFTPTGNDTGTARAEANSMVVQGEGWTIELPPEPISRDADAYFSRLRLALGL